MTTADDHWPATLERVVATLDFQVEGPDRTKPEVKAKLRGDPSQLPALVSLAMKAAIQVDQRVAIMDPAPPVDRKAVLARKDMARAMVDGAHNMLLTGYVTAYRVELARILWTGIADAPRQRLEELARPPAS